jgi:hypothetical protein
LEAKQNRLSMMYQIMMIVEDVCYVYAEHDVRDSDAADRLRKDTNNRLRVERAARTAGTCRTGRPVPTCPCSRGIH